MIWVDGDGVLRNPAAELAVREGRQATTIRAIKLKRTPSRNHPITERPLLPATAAVATAKTSQIKRISIMMSYLERDRPGRIAGMPRLRRPFAVERIKEPVLLRGGNGASQRELDGLLALGVKCVKAVAIDVLKWPGIGSFVGRVGCCMLVTASLII